LLSNSVQTVAQTAWRVLQLLPSNQSLRSAILNFETEESRAEAAAFLQQQKAASPAVKAAPSKTWAAMASTPKPSPSKPPAAASIAGLTDVSWTHLLTFTDPTRLLNVLLVRFRLSGSPF
jgi:cell division septation protein DedD